MTLFKTLQPNTIIYYLDKESLTTGSGIVKIVSLPHVQAVPTVSAAMVIDVTISINGEDKIYTMPDTASVAYAGDIVLATERDSLLGECTKMKEDAENVLSKIDKYKAIIDNYDSLVLSLKPEEAREKNINDRLSKLEDSIDEILKLLSNKA